MLAFGRVKCPAKTVSTPSHPVQKSLATRNPAVRASRRPHVGLSRSDKRTKHIARAADTASAQNAQELVLPAEEVLQTLKIGQRSDGMFIIEDVVEGSNADKQSIKKGSVLSAVSDPAAPTSMWELEARSSLRHVLDQMRMQQSATVKLAILPPSAADEQAVGRLGLNRDGAVMNQETAQRRQQQRAEFDARGAGNNTTNWLLLAVGVIIVPVVGILALAISSGFLDEMNAGWRAGF